MNILPKLIDDKKVRVKTLREFLGKEFPKDSLPTVDEARALAAGHRHAMELFGTNEQRTAREARQKEQREALQHKQQGRRVRLEREGKALAERQGQARHDLSGRQLQSGAALRQGYLQDTKRIRLDRAAHRPKGLAAFLGRVTGVELITTKIQQYRDATRYKAYLAQKTGLKELHQRETAALARQQELQTLTMQRRLRALELIDQREVRSLENALLKERRVEDRERTGREPAHERQSDVFNKAAKKPIDLTAEFDRAAGSSEGGGEASGESAQDPAPEGEITIQRRRRTKDRSQDIESSAKSKSPDHDSDGDDPSDDDPAPRRRRNRDLDRGR